MVVVEIDHNRAMFCFAGWFYLYNTKGWEKVSLVELRGIRTVTAGKWGGKECDSWQLSI